MLCLHFELRNLLNMIPTQIKRCSGLLYAGLVNEYKSEFQFRKIPKNLFKWRGESPQKISYTFPKNP